MSERADPMGAEAAVVASNAALSEDQIAVFKAVGGGWASQSERQADRWRPAAPNLRRPFLQGIESMPAFEEPKG